MDAITTITRGLRRDGFAHVPNLLASAPAHDEFLALARALGSLVVPPGCDPACPVVETKALAAASVKRPFDRQEGIGWHNDFTTHRARPRWTLMWIVQPDPGGGQYGAWRVASTKDILSDRDVRRASIWRHLTNTRFAFGYAFEQQVRYFKILCQSRGPGLRFNRRGLLEGSMVAHGAVSTTVQNVVDAIATAADRRSVVIAAGAGDVLAVDNWRSLHDRMELSVTDSQTARVACLCFIDAGKPHARRHRDARAAKWD